MDLQGFLASSVVANLLAFFDAASLALVLFLFIKLMKGHSKKEWQRRLSLWIYAAVLLYFIYKAAYFYMDFSFSMQAALAMAANVSLLLSGTIIFGCTKNAIVVLKEGLDAN
ncbi:Uncharacterised protein [uncultured archaeon]|nr:Uncharacterised protein [uncultured archaeon]